jgi:antitoxin CptB
MPEQIEAARGDAVRQPEQAAEGRFKMGPDALDLARGREQGGESIVRLLSGRPSSRMRSPRAAGRSAAGLCKPVAGSYILGHRTVGNPHDSRSAPMSEPIAIRRKRLVYQSRYRGRLEGDLLLGRFADRYIAGFSRPELDRYEALLGESDQDLFAWISGQAPVPARHDHDVFGLLRAFRFVVPAE